MDWCLFIWEFDFTERGLTLNSMDYRNFIWFLCAVTNSLATVSDEAFASDFSESSHDFLNSQ